MNARLTWPDIDSRGVVELHLSRSDLRTLLAGAECPVRGGMAGLVSVDSAEDLVVVVTVGEVGHAEG